MKRAITLATFVVLSIVAWIELFPRGENQPRAAAEALTNSPARERSDGVALASPGRLEGRSETIQVGAATDGVVRALYVREGQTVHRGEILAEIGCDDLKAARLAATAELESIRQSRARLLRGSRLEEREVAAQKTMAARAVLEQASSQFARIQKLYEAQTTSKMGLDESQRDRDVAAAGLKSAIRSEELVNADALPEEIARANSDVAAGEQRERLAADKLDKCTVRAPADGTVLRVSTRVGELFSALVPRPLLSLADLSVRRVRAEVDERDIGNTFVGQRVAVIADAYPMRHFTGKVSALVPTMGRKSVLTGSPVEKSDRDVLEVIAELNSDSTDLPIGLRVTVQFMR
jgi:HlyD family secretion protein